MGFTHCPDICPTTMATAANFYDSLSGEDQNKIQIALISLDPERDTAEKTLSICSLILIKIL